MVVRRKVPPYVAHILWDAVRFITHNRQLANHGRLSKYLQKERPEMTMETAEQFVTDSIEEGIIVAAPKGFGPQSYVLPSSEHVPGDDGHDWYCIECHMPGDVEFCRKCHRVFHTECQSKSKNDLKIPKPKLLNTPGGGGKRRRKSLKEKDTDKPNLLNPDDKQPFSNENSETENSQTVLNTPEASQVTSDPSVCSLCKITEADNFTIDNTKLNYLCTFLFTRIRNWLPANVTDGIAPPPPEPWHVLGDNVWRGRYLLYQPVDVKSMELKARTREYKCLNEIYADILSIRHNVAVYHGVNSTEMQAVDYMLFDARHDIDEIRQCIDCYQNSNEKKNRRWFCIPCNPPHELVWAKQKGFSYWPAKVIKKTAKQYDVRFFGAKYLRAVIDENFIKPINVPLINLKVKKSSAFNKAYEELQLHQEWLRSPASIAKYVTETTPRKRGRTRKHSVGDLDLEKETKKQKDESLITRKIANYQNSCPDSILEQVPSTPSCILVTAVTVNEGNVRKKRKSLPATALSSTSETRETRKKPSLTKSSKKNPNTSAIIISDAEDDTHLNKNQSQEDLISSTQDIRYHSNLDISANSPENPPTLQDNKNVEAADKLRRQLEVCFDRKQMIQIACDAIQEQVDKFTEKIRTMVATQTAIISDIKKKQWCYNCEQEAIYHCCWNTSYCSTECQQIHWHADHKRNCRRKRV